MRLRGDVHVLAEDLSTKEVSFIMCLFEVDVNLYAITYLWILIIFTSTDHTVAYLKCVFTLVTVFLLLFQATHTVCYYEEITDNHSDYSLGLPVFDELESYNTIAYSTIIFQTTNYSDRTSDGPETSNS